MSQRVEVPAGRFDGIVIRPVIRAKGVFSEDGRAEVWLSNDADHVVLQMRSHLKFGTLSLHLRSHSVRAPTDSTGTTGATSASAPR